MSTTDNEPINQPEAIQSPCIGVCSMSEASGLCQGCYRTIDEIREWWDMTADQRNMVMAKLCYRGRRIAADS